MCKECYDSKDFNPCNKNMFCLHKNLLIDCDTEEKDECHRTEVENIFNSTLSWFPFGAICMIKKTDVAHKDLPTEYCYCDDEDIFNIFEREDIKNGVDFYFYNHANKTADSFVALVHGQGYTFKNQKENHYLETLFVYKVLSKDSMESLLSKSNEDGEINKNILKSCFQNTKQKIELD